MEENDFFKRNKLIIIIPALVLALLIIIWVFGYFIKSERHVDNLSLSYLPVSYYTDGEDIILDEDDKNKIYDYIRSLKLSDPVQATLDVKYKLQVGNDSYLIGDGSAIIKNDETFEVSKGIDELVNYLDNKIKKIDRVYFYTVDEMNNYSKVELTDGDKFIIREAWEKQNKKVLQIEEAIVLKSVVVIDDDVIRIDEFNKYAEYQDGFIEVDDALSEAINQLTDSCSYNGNKKLTYEIDNEMNSSNSTYNKRGIYYDIPKCYGVPAAYTIASGEKNNGGYSIRIDKIDIDEENNVVVHIIEEKPAEGTSTTMALTYPVCRVTFNTIPNSIKFITETGEELKSAL